MEPKVKQKRLDEDWFLEWRKEILSSWPTGKEVDLDEAVAYHKSMPDSKNFGKLTAKVCKEGKSLLWPRAGTPILEEEIALVKTLVDSGIRHIPVTTDSYTRAEKYKEAQQAIDESIKAGKALLNGYPIVNHGVKNTRKVIESVDAAFSPRGTNRISLEIAFASGMTGGGGDAFLGFGSYSKYTTLEETIQTSQRSCRLAGLYADRGVIITPDLHGWLPAGVFPLSVNIACLIVDALINAEQGVKSIIPLVHSMGHMAQDIAWMRVTPKLLREYLDKLGYSDVVVPGTFCNQIPLFPVPQGLGGAFAYLTYTAMVCSLANVEAVGIRTIDEGAGVPTREAHALSYNAASWICDVVREQKIEFDSEDIRTEEKVTETEVRAILEKLLEVGDGDIVVGAIKGADQGIIDSPFSPNVNIKDNVLGVRDNKGACRILEFGNLPIPADIKEFHRKRIAEREEAENRKMDYYVAVQDLWALSQGKLIGRPS
jgi:methylaspartate mutase epsilon subunit